MKMVAAELGRIRVYTADQFEIDGDALEAVAFAILAYHMLRERQSNVPGVTGARAPAILDKLTTAPTPSR